MAISISQPAPDIFLAVGAHTNWCLIREGTSITLIDAAWPRDYRLVVDSLAEIGASPGDVEAILLTHAHPDHVGVAERLRAEHRSTVFAHEDEVAHATGRSRERVSVLDLMARLWRPSVLAFVASSIWRGGLRPTPVEEVEGFSEQRLDVPGSPTPVPTPGHTSGHCAFYLPERGVLVTGDALVNANVLTNSPGPRLMPGIFNHDAEQANASLDHLLPLAADVLLPGHGNVIEMPIASAIEIARKRLADSSRWDR
ncbi:MAG: MBL fold metallo-hydrolase [Acidimicrobiia bacterium]|nr:MAG: MBL fold metallo-hydrolase [Acidimicrobiia bacterium]